MNSQYGSDSEGGVESGHIDEHRCLDLIQGLLHPGEEEKLLAHLAACPECEKRFQDMASRAERLAATCVLRILPTKELVQEKRGSALRDEPADPGKRDTMGFLLKLRDNVLSGFRQPRFQLSTGLVLAAAILLLIFWPDRGKTPGDIQIYKLPPYDFQLQPREAWETAPSDDLVTGLASYEEGDFRRAAELLNRAQRSDLNDVDELIRQIYVGSSLAWIGEHGDAVTVLRQLPFPLLPEEWGGEAHWTLYAAMIESGQKTSADSLLGVLAGKPGKIGDRARRILGR